MTPNSPHTTALALVFLLGFTVDIGTLHAQTNDFAFRFQFGCDGTESLDTFRGSFTQDATQGPARSVTIPLSLSTEQMRAIFDTIQKIRFFDYPAVFMGLRPGAREAITTSPSTRYRFEVRQAGRSHVVTWDDNTKPSSNEADRLRQLFQMIDGFVHAHPDVKRLPPQFGCE
jgi:hypothetical protein